MKAIVSLIGLSLALATSHAFAKDYVLLDTDKAPKIGESRAKNSA